MIAMLIVLVVTLPEIVERGSVDEFTKRQHCIFVAWPDGDPPQHSGNYDAYTCSTSRRIR